MAEAPPPPPEAPEGPRGPPGRHKFLTISNLEYVLYSPKGCAVELKLPRDRAPYIAWWDRHGSRLLRSGFIIRIFGQAEMGKMEEGGEDGLYHIQLYYEDVREAPTFEDIDALFELKPWQRKIFTAGNPYASGMYCNKAKSRMPGAQKFCFGGLPPEGTFPGYERRGGKRAGAGRPADPVDEQGHKRSRGGWHKKVMEMVTAGCTFQQLIVNPEILYDIKPSYQLAQSLHRMHDVPDYQMRPGRKMYVFWLWGASKSGKSTELTDWCVRNGRKWYKLKPVKGKFFEWWQRTKGDENTLILDDFDGQCWFRDLINLMDPTDTLGDVKNSDAVLRFNVILISSPVHPRDCMFFFDNAMKRRKMKDPVNEIAHFLNRFFWGGIYFWTRFPERHCICMIDREKTFLEEWVAAFTKGEETEHLKMKTCSELWLPSPTRYEEAQAYGYHPCNPPPPDAPAWDPSDPVHLLHQPHIPPMDDIVNPKWLPYGPKSPLEIRAEEVENLLRGLVLNDQGVWVAPPLPPPPFFPPEIRPFYEVD